MKQRLLLLVFSAILLTFLFPVSWAKEPNRSLPPVPEAARHDLMNASEVIEILMRRSDKAAGSAEWDVVIEHLKKAQEKAPQAPQILMNLGLAQEMRGRNLAAVSWLTAAWWAITRVDIHLPQVSELHKRISALNRKVDNEIELLLRFAKDQIAYIHTTTPPKGEWEGMSLFPPMLAAIGGGYYKQLPNGQFQFVRFPEPEVTKQQLEQYLIELELFIGYYKAITDTVEHCNKYYPNDLFALYKAHYKAYQVLIDAAIKVKDWEKVSRLSSGARRWAETQGLSSPQDREVFEKSRLEANEKMLQEKPEMKLSQWIELAKEQSNSDDEILLDVKVDILRRQTNKDASILEGIAKAIAPIAYQRQRQSAITSIYNVGSWN